MWEVFDKLCKERGVSAYRVGEETGIKTSALSAWKNEWAESIALPNESD